MKNKKRKKREKRRDFQNLKQELNPLLTIDEGQGESLFVIVDFSIPRWNHVRRILAKRLANGNITAVIYAGTPGPDNTCVKKEHVLQMTAAPEKKFWEAYQVLELLYKTAGGTVEVRNYDGRSIREAAELMKKFNHAQVFIGDECDRINL